MKRILVAEDEATLREGIVEALRSRGYEVVEAPDGTAALRRIDDDELFDLVVTDLMMPGADGIEVVRRVKLVNESTTAVVMTAFGTIEKAVQAMQAGAYDFLQKPFTLETLELKIRQALEYGRMVRQIQSYQRTAPRGAFENIV